jgi:hypothetical protein
VKEGKKNKKKLKKIIIRKNTSDGGITHTQGLFGNSGTSSGQRQMCLHGNSLGNHYLLWTVWHGRARVTRLDCGCMPAWHLDVVATLLANIGQHSACRAALTN